MMRITFGVTTFNRLEVLRKMAKSLAAVNDIERCNIRIYDDCSSEFTPDFLRQLFPLAKTILVRKKNGGADINMGQMYRDFLATEDDIFVSADSDLIFHPSIVEQIHSLAPLCDGVFSLYNSIAHPSIRTVTISGQKWLEKKTLGAAGVVFNRRVLQSITEKIPLGPSYDYKWSAHLAEQGLRLLCTKQSYIQHIGIYGQNHIKGFAVDFGLNFHPGNAANEELLIDFFDQVITSNNRIWQNQHKSIVLLRMLCRVIGRAILDYFGKARRAFSHS